MPVCFDPRTETNILNAPDAFADESCTADGSTCKVTAAVDKDGNLALGVNDAVYACTPDSDGRRRLSQMPTDDEEALLVLWRRCIIACMLEHPKGEGRDACIETCKPAPTPAPTNVDCVGGASTGGTKPGGLGMDTSETAEVTEVLVGSSGDPDRPANSSLGGTIGGVDIFDKALSVEDILATAPTAAPTASPTASPSARAPDPVGAWDLRSEVSSGVVKHWYRNETRAAKLCSWGGTCTCPDGAAFQVHDDCTECAGPFSACAGGAMTGATCNKQEGPWSRKRVTCDSNAGVSTAPPILGGDAKFVPAQPCDADGGDGRRLSQRPTNDAEAIECIAYCTRTHPFGDTRRACIADCMPDEEPMCGGGIELDGDGDVVIIQDTQTFKDAISSGEPGDVSVVAEVILAGDEDGEEK